MGIEKITIEGFIPLLKKYPVIDVRSEGEYNHAHIPNAYSLPLFNNEERKIVGTLYKQKSREEAIKKGLEIFGPKMKAMIDFGEQIIPKNNPSNKTVIVHCWRGGMRSAGVAWLFDLYGFKVYTLVGGYKVFRNWVLDVFRIKFNFTILGGYTGSGKTIILQELRQMNQPMVDLEGIAGHKGSAFGRIGLPMQPSTEMFENRLAVELISISNQYPNETIWIEDESQRIGNVSIPHQLWETIRSSRINFINISFEERLNYLVDTYGILDRNELEEAITRIQKKLGGLEMKTAIEYLKTNDMHGCFSILLKYYDKLYKKSLENREHLKTLLQNFDLENVNGKQNAEYLINRTHGQ